MLSLTKTFTAWTACSAAFLGAAFPLASGVFSSSTAMSVPVAGQVTAVAAAAVRPAAAAVAALRPVAAAAAVAALAPAVAPVIALRQTADDKASVGLDTEQALRARIKFETVRWGGKPVQTLDEESRLLLARAAAERAGLEKVGLSAHDLYGIIEAETSWIARTGASKDGTPNLGLAQFEPRTAAGLGLKDPTDPVQAVFAAALYIRQGAQWASGRLGSLKLPPDVYAAKLREGVSVHYNLSIKGRNKWDGLNTAELPIETQRHIRNARAGAAESLQLARDLRA